MYSPDGKKTLCHNQGDLFVMNDDGTFE